MKNQAENTLLIPFRTNHPTHTHTDTLSSSLDSSTARETDCCHGNYICMQLGMCFCAGASVSPRLCTKRSMCAAGRRLDGTARGIYEPERQVRRHRASFGSAFTPTLGRNTALSSRRVKTKGSERGVRRSSSSSSSVHINSKQSQ